MTDREKLLLGVVGLGIGAVIVYFLTKPKASYITYPLPQGGYVQIPTYSGYGTPLAEVKVRNPITGEVIGTIRAYTYEQLDTIYKVLLYQNLADLLAELFKQVPTLTYQEGYSGEGTIAKPIGQPIPRQKRFGELI